jgi:hypothetical protein
MINREALTFLTQFRDDLQIELCNKFTVYSQLTPEWKACASSNFKMHVKVHTGLF